MKNRLYYGDNLEVLRSKDFPDGFVDLIYLDPPFNSNANYNILFRSPGGEAAGSQIEAFEDSWHWNDSAEAAFHGVMTSGNTDVAELLRAMRGFLKENDMMAYLAMMAVRLLELHRVLKPTGSLYLHCDPTASHYLKLLLDGVFGADHFKNEITWKRTGSHGDSKTWSRVSDTIFFYSKSSFFRWNEPLEPHREAYKQSHYSSADENGRRFQLTSILSPSPRPNMMYEWMGFPSPLSGWRFSKETMGQHHENGLIWYPRAKDGSLDTKKRPIFKRYLDEQLGTRVPTIWSDIPPVNARAQERLGYPTQKPLALLERIIAASSNPGDLVLDPFCGCGTAVDAAQKLGRRWIGIDITHLAIGAIEKRMARYGDGLDYEVIGVPKDLPSAEKLAAEQPHQFQYWITHKIDGVPYQGGRKGPDRGIDGFVYFTGHADERGVRKTEAAIVSVKAGRNVGPAMVRDLKGTMERERAPMAIFVCVILPTREMEREAAAAGVYEGADGRQYPRLQLFTLAELFQGKRPAIPLLDRDAAWKRARPEAGGGNQGRLAV